MVRTEPIKKEITGGKLAVKFTDLQKKSENTRHSGFTRQTSAQLERGPKTLGSLPNKRLPNSHDVLATFLLAFFSC